MKKIMLCSVVMCCVCVSYGFAADDSCDMVNETCKYVDVGGGYEQEKCLEIAVAPGIGRYNWCAQGTVNKYWYKSGHECSPTNAPQKSGICIKQDGKKYTNVYCDAERYVNSKKPEKCICKDSDAARKELETEITSCAATYCNSDSLLYMTNNASRKDRKRVVKDAKIEQLKSYMLGQSVASQGLCRKRADLEKACEKCSCSDGKKCVLNEVTVENRGKNVQAFIGEEMCKCVAKEGSGGGKQEEQKPNVCPEKDCKDTCNVTINESIKCNNGKKFESKKTVKVCKECVEQQKMTCEQYQETINKCDDLKCIENRLKQLTEIDKLLNEWCGAGYSTTTPDNGAQINAAKSTISSFFSSAESSASVWKDKDGNFNTARLASDLTAGVVLGTVGGVVSGVVIKKKQVEKGFDALHCTVGGQTVADWGDIFNVGLRR